MKDQINTIRRAVEAALSDDHPYIGACKQALTALSELEAMVGEPEFALPETPFQEVAPGIEVGYDFFGGVDIRLGGEFVYVHINYDHRYTHNSARAHLADQIVGLLTGKDAAPPAQQQKLEDSEQYRMQMAGISTAATGYWKEGDSIHPDYDTPALRDVAKLYAKYDELYKAQQPQARPDFTDEWTGYLKDGETPFERFLRERRDLSALTTLYQRALEENERLKAQQPQAEKRCQYCDGTGDVHSIDGQWRGECHCQKQPQAEAVAWKHDCAALLTNDVELWIDNCPHCGKPRATPPAPQQAEAVPVLTDSQIMASVDRNAGGPDTSISESRPLGQQWTQICALVRHIIRERYCGVAHQQAEAVLHRYVLELPDDDTRKVRVHWIERKESAGEITHNLCIAVDAAPQAEDGMTKLRDMLQEAVDRLTAAPQQAEAVPSDVVRDAERWRMFLATRPANTHAVINDAIDAAIAAQGEKP